MTAKKNRRERFFYCATIFCGIISIWLTISHVAHFRWPDYFYNANPDVEVYVGTNVVSPFADFSFFTYITMLLWGAWCVSSGLARIFKCEKLLNVLTTDGLTCFVFVNYVFTTILYTVFSLTSGGDFGLYSKTEPLAWHNFGTNIIAHYLLFIASVVIFLNVETRESSLFKVHALSSAFLLTYYVAVKITGETAYRIRWFPYVIFDARSLGAMIGITDYVCSLLLLIVVCVLIFFAYQAVLRLLVRYKRNLKNTRKNI